MNQLTTVETTRNQKLLKDLMQNKIQLNFTVNQLENQAKQLYALVNFINFMLAVRHKLAMIRDSTFAIQQDLDHLYMYLNTLSIKKLIPEMLTPYNLRALLNVVIEDLKSQPKLSYLSNTVSTNTTKLLQYLQLCSMKCSCVLYTYLW